MTSMAYLVSCTVLKGGKLFSRDMIFKYVLFIIMYSLLCYFNYYERYEVNLMTVMCFYVFLITY